MNWTWNIHFYFAGMLDKVKDASRYMYSLQITYSVSLIESLLFFVRIVTISEECKMLNRLSGVASTSSHSSVNTCISTKSQAGCHLARAAIVD